jgi:hypothetical protein
MKTLSENLTNGVDKETGELILISCPRVQCFAYCPASQKRYAMPCKSRQCDFCGKIWSLQWRWALKLQADHNEMFKLPKTKMALTLTYAEYADNKVVHACLRYFWQQIRKAFPLIQYWGVVEFNQAHTLPHLHFVISHVDFLPYGFVRSCWQTAQKWAGITTTAFIVRVEKIRGNAQSYFTKYITKLIGSKDEIPRRENWSGRYVRYSRGFFPVGLPAMKLAFRLNKMFHVEQSIEKFAVFSRRSGLEPDQWVENQDFLYKEQQEIINLDWSPTQDKEIAIPIVGFHAKIFGVGTEPLWDI